MSVDFYMELVWGIAEYVDAFAPRVSLERNGVIIPSLKAGSALPEFIRAAEQQHEVHFSKFREFVSSIRASNPPDYVLDIEALENDCRKVMASKKITPGVDEIKNRRKKEVIRRIFTQERIEDRLRIALARTIGQNPSTFSLPSTITQPDEKCARYNAGARAQFVRNHVASPA